MRSSGLLIYNSFDGVAKVLLVHPGGPYWENKDIGAWSIPKGVPEKGEDLLEAAFRETYEELGQKPEGKISFPLGSVRQNKNKVVYCWAFNGTVTLPTKSNMTTVEWPSKSGKEISIPEVDKSEWFDFNEARKKINSKQVVFIDRLERKLEKI